MRQKLACLLKNRLNKPKSFLKLLLALNDAIERGKITNYLIWFTSCLGQIGEPNRQY